MIRICYAQKFSWQRNQKIEKNTENIHNKLDEDKL